MNLIIPLFYIVLLAFLLTRIPWLGQAGFGKRFVLLFFVGKCLAGFAYNFIALRFLPHQGDIWPFFEDGLEMYREYLQSPKAFWETYGQIFHYSDFNATSTNSDFIRTAFEIIRLLHFGLNFFTLGSLWANTVIFNFGATLCFFYCWRFFKSQLGSQALLAGLVFLLLPSMFFYSAGILKEGIVISLLCLLIPLSHKLLQRFSLKVLLGWVLLFVILLVVKIFVAALWLVCMLLWWLLQLFPSKQWLVALGVIAVATLFFLYSNRITPGMDLPNYLVKRQHEFLELPAGSSVYIEPLTRQPVSYVKALPVALNNALFKPLPSEGGKALYSLYAVEMILFWIGVAIIIWKRSSEPLPASQKRLATVLLLFALLNLLLIGLIVPNIGSIIRYRSIFMPFMAVAVIIFCRLKPVSEKWNPHLRKWINR